MYYQRFLEVYYGEKDNIKEMQKCITNFRKDLFKHPMMAELNTHPEIRKFNRLAEKEWGFKSYALTILPTLETNACTFPLWYRPGTLFSKHNAMSNVIITNKGYKYKKEAEYCCTTLMFKGLIINKDYTDREIMAIILHEIGHNFQAAISDTQATLSGSCYIINVVNTLINLILSGDALTIFTGLYINSIVYTGKINDLMNYLDQVMYENAKGLYYFQDVVLGVLYAIKYPIDKLLNFIRMIENVARIPFYLLIELNPISLLTKALTGNYRGEKMADNFATIYGYGPETASVQKKFVNISPLGPISKVKIPLLSPVAGLFEATYRLLITLPDEHPQAISRIKDQRDYLEKELMFGDFDPKFKKDIQNQIKEIDKTIDELNTFNYKGAISDYKYFDKFYQCLIYRLFGGDIKDLMGLFNPNDIHKDLETVKKRKMNETGDVFIDTLNKTIFI